MTGGADTIALEPPEGDDLSLVRPAVATDLGLLYGTDCFNLFAALKDASIDCIFADPPFNLGKDYGSGVVRDALERRDYLKLVLDPFGGGGSTYEAAQRLKRYWLGSEITTARAVRERFARQFPALTASLPRPLSRVFIEPDPSFRLAIHRAGAANH